MTKLLFILFICVIGVFFYKNKIHIKLKSFLHKGFLPQRGNFGVYCYCGKQGTGKTYSVVEYLIDNQKNSLIFANIKDIKNIEYEFYVGFKGLLEIKHRIDNGDISTDKQIVIVYDELFTELQRFSKLSPEVMDFLCQMRKRKIILLTTCQQWRQVPKDFRDFCRYQIDCNMINLFFVGLLIKRFKDAENDKWDDSEQDFVAPLLETTISKCRKFIANSYDTFLRISSVNAVKSSLQGADKSSSAEVEKKEEKIDTAFWDDISSDDMVQAVQVVNEVTE